MDKQKINLAKYRFEKAKEEFEISKILFDKKYYRASLSSSYYSIFHAVRTLLVFEKLDGKKNSGVIALFIEKYFRTGLIEAKTKDILTGILR